MLLKKPMSQWVNQREKHLANKCWHASKKKRKEKKIREYLKTNENVNTTLQNLQAIEKEVLRVKFKAIQVYIKKQKISQINNQTHLTFNLT